MSVVATRKLLGASLIAIVLLATATYVAVRAVRADEASAKAGLDPSRPGTMIYVDGITGRVGQINLTASGQAIEGGPFCYRAHAAAGTLVCLRPTLPAGFEAAIFDENMAEVKTIALWGTPSRARVSASGRLAAWTVFHRGDAYLQQGQFSTIAGIYNIDTGEHIGRLEDFTATVDGKPFRPVDLNYWGITFAADDRTFYATMAAGGQTWLVRGDLQARTLTAIHSNVECPSLSPDGTRIAYKKRIGDQWRLHALNLTTMTETPLAEPQTVDDQPAWLDADTIVYARPVAGRPALFTVPADGTGTPKLLRENASSPAFIRS